MTEILYMAHLPRLKTHKVSRLNVPPSTGRKPKTYSVGRLAPVRVTPEDGAVEAYKKRTFNLGR
jgi:hypothetical protein